ncbi:hypothetical protein SKAU_G00232210 [Synaphobranchus kaupii]|uniref:Uncharacterized protein n=1 Tax=Synaphobranchus kaupii TaxID=118154 RepID=A0A9Q1ISG8_SYNKA|nr:hypothetical protein SKAU_G00232210 [Synaphobranchus kaupii]
MHSCQEKACRISQAPPLTLWIPMEKTTSDLVRVAVRSKEAVQNPTCSMTRKLHTGIRQEPSQGEEFGAEAAALRSSCADCELARETLFPILTTCDLSVRKSRIQLQVGVGTPRSVSFTISFIGRIVLKAELIVLVQMFQCGVKCQGTSKYIMRGSHCNPLRINCMAL